jgi:hypothetical protein
VVSCSVGLCVTAGVRAGTEVYGGPTFDSEGTAGAKSPAPPPRRKTRVEVRAVAQNG